MPWGQLVRITWRGLFRHRTRTFLLTLVTAYVTATLLFMFGFLDGYGESLAEAYGRYIQAPVVVARAEYFQDPDPQNGLDRPVFLPYPATPRLAFFALVQTPYRSEGLEALGVDPEGEKAVSRVPFKVAQGRWLEGRGEVVLGAKLAERLDVRLGERLVLETAALLGPQALGLRVVGLLRAGVSNVDYFGLYLHLEDARTLTGVWATHLAVQAPRGQEEQVAKRLRSHLPQGLEAREVWEVMGPIKADYQASRLFYTPILALFVLLAALAVTSTTYVSVRERMREFAVTEALGLFPKGLLALVALEAALATALGFLAGLALGYALLFYTSTHNVLGGLMALSVELLPDAGLMDTLYTSVRPVYALYAFGVVVLSGLLAALFPGRLVLRMDLPRYLRGE
ncbi:ABC transporter permease [Thermus filiformis]|uniref:ABC transporter permease n=1 Tax=Thermus filiformis TaxID=276 RepID=A0A0A2XAJ1_THEFI|nr:FtsX-like permease family protein [Thermus filiformis]KGQ22174.1 ABC transporter permease [Thermus filiformis]